MLAWGRAEPTAKVQLWRREVCQGSQCKLPDWKSGTVGFLKVFPNFFKAPLQTQRSKICAIRRVASLQCKMSFGGWKLSVCFAVLWAKVSKQGAARPQQDRNSLPVSAASHPPWQTGHPNCSAELTPYRSGPVIWASPSLKTPKLLITNWKARYLSCCSVSQV